MASRALWFVVALCTLQVSQAFSLASIFNVTAAVETLENVVKTLESSAESQLNSTLESIATQVNAVVTRLESNVTSAITDVTSQILKLVEAAENEGIAAGSCGITATVNLTKIYAALPVSLGHCYIDYLDVFNYYVANIKNDISASYQAIKDAVSEAVDCSFIDVLCYGNVFLNATEFEKKKAEDVTFQLVDSSTAAINLVATITLCDEEKSTQAVLDVYHVIPDTKKCIDAKKAALTVSSNTTSS